MKWLMVEQVYSLKRRRKNPMRLIAEILLILVFVLVATLFAILAHVK